MVLPDSKWYGFTGLGVGLAMDVRFLEYLSARAALNTIAYLGTGNGAVIAVGSTARITGSRRREGKPPGGQAIPLRRHAST